MSFVIAQLQVLLLIVSQRVARARNFIEIARVVSFGEGNICSKLLRDCLGKLSTRNNNSELIQRITYDF